MLPINYTKAREIISLLSDNDSPYSALWESLSNFKSLSFSDRMIVVCECTSPIQQKNCTIIVNTQMPDVIYGLVHIDGEFVSFIDITDIWNAAMTHESKRERVYELLLEEEVITHQHEYTIMLVSST